MGFKLRRVLVAILFILPLCPSLNLPSTGGGYENLVIAINEKYKPGNGDKAAEEAFIEKIKAFITTASRRLFEATQNTFYFQTVKILIPSTWVTIAPTRAVDESLATADVRVFPFDTTSSGTYLGPFTQRSKYCGAQGEYIYLSPEYINTVVTQSNPANAFVHEFAVYRYGLFEEYGIDRDRFPYMEAPSTDQSTWKVTGCSDAKIEGKYRYFDFDDNGVVWKDSCSVSLVEDGYCRFLPNPEGQTAKTSILFAPQINSVNHFCDKDTHNRTSKNRHNYHCNERSAWDVMRNHPDFTDRKNSTSFPNDPNYSLVQSVYGIPAIYVLIDTSNGTAAAAVFGSIKTKLSSWVSTSLPKTTLVGLGEFGGTTATEPNGLPFKYITNKLSPGPVSSVSAQFSSLINGLTQTKPSGINIDKAIGDASVLLTSRFWQQGSIIMLIKLTGNKEVKASLPEGPIIDLLTARKARLYSIEYQVAGDSTSSVARVASESFGKAYFGGSSTSEFNLAFDNMLSDVGKVASGSGALPPSRKIEIGIQSFEVQPGESYSSKFQTHVTGSPLVAFDFHVTAGKSVTIGIQPTNTTTYPLQKQTGTSWLLNQWDLYSAKFTETALTLRSAWCFNVKNSGNGAVSVVATAYQSRTKDPPGLGDPTDQKGDIHELELWTSDINGEITVSNSPYRPFGIYAYFFNGLRHIKGLIVHAIVTDPSGNFTKVRLYDDKPNSGPGNYDVDIEDNDGVYSTIFNPVTVGYHHITIEASSPRPPKCTSGRSVEVDQREISYSSLSSRIGGKSLLADQYQLYPPFGSVGASQAYFQRYFPYFKSVNVKFTAFTPVPPRVLSLKAEAATAESHVTFTFSEPHLYEGAEAPDIYTIRYATDRSNLIRADGTLNPSTTSTTAVLTDHITEGDLNHVGTAAQKQLTFRVYAPSAEVQPVYFIVAGGVVSGSTTRYGPPSPITEARVMPILSTTTSTSTPSTTTIITSTTPSTTTVITGSSSTTQVTTERTTRRTTTLKPIITEGSKPTEEPEPGSSNMVVPTSLGFILILSWLIM